VNLVDVVRVMMEQVTVVKVVVVENGYAQKEILSNMVDSKDKHLVVQYLET
jgi:hypothetical protein